VRRCANNGYELCSFFPPSLPLFLFFPPFFFFFPGNLLRQSSGPQVPLLDRSNRQNTGSEKTAPPSFSFPFPPPPQTCSVHGIREKGRFKEGRGCRTQGFAAPDGLRLFSSFSFSLPFFSFSAWSPRRARFTTGGNGAGCEGERNHEHRATFLFFPSFPCTCSMLSLEVLAEMGNSGTIEAFLPFPPPSLFFFFRPAGSAVRGPPPSFSGKFFLFFFFFFWRGWLDPGVRWKRTKVEKGARAMESPSSLPFLPFSFDGLDGKGLDS